MTGQDLAKVVRTRGRTVDRGQLATRAADGTPDMSPDVSRFHVVAYDYGVKRNVLRLMADRGCRVTVVPAQTSAAEVLKLAPDGVFLSDGPGNPEPCTYAIEATREFIARRLPTFGICLGHQIMGLAVGGRTLKMKFGHHGANHPVLEVETKKVYITEPEPRLRGRRAVAAGGCQGHARIAVRRLAAGLHADRCAGVLFPGSSGGEPGTARHPGSVRSLHRGDGGADHTAGDRRRAMSPRCARVAGGAAPALRACLPMIRCWSSIAQAGRLLAETFAAGGRAYSCGNGGSMCDAMHFAEELTGRFRDDRPGYAAIAISDPRHLSCVGNDYGYGRCSRASSKRHGWCRRCAARNFHQRRHQQHRDVGRPAASAERLGVRVIALTGRTGTH